MLSSWTGVWNGAEFVISVVCRHPCCLHPMVPLSIWHDSTSPSTLLVLTWPRHCLSTSFIMKMTSETWVHLSPWKWHQKYEYIIHHENDIRNMSKSFTMKMTSEMWVHLSPWKWHQKCECIFHHENDRNVSTSFTTKMTSEMWVHACVQTYPLLSVSTVFFIFSSLSPLAYCNSYILGGKV